MVRSFDYGDAWHCSQCHTGNDDGDYCQECHATRDGAHTYECDCCSDRFPREAMATVFACGGLETFACEGCRS